MDFLKGNDDAGWASSYPSKQPAKKPPPRKFGLAALDDDEEEMFKDLVVDDLDAEPALEDPFKVDAPMEEPSEPATAAAHDEAPSKNAPVLKPGLAKPPLPPKKPAAEGEAFPKQRTCKSNPLGAAVRMFVSAKPEAEDHEEQLPPTSTAEPRKADDQHMAEEEGSSPEPTADGDAPKLQQEAPKEMHIDASEEEQQPEPMLEGATAPRKQADVITEPALFATEFSVAPLFTQQDPAQPAPAEKPAQPEASAEQMQNQQQVQDQQRHEEEGQHSESLPEQATPAEEELPLPAAPAKPTAPNAAAAAAMAAAPAIAPVAAPHSKSSPALAPATNPLLAMQRRPPAAVPSRGPSLLGSQAASKPKEAAASALSMQALLQRPGTINKVPAAAPKPTSSALPAFMRKTLALAPSTGLAAKPGLAGGQEGNGTPAGLMRAGAGMYATPPIITKLAAPEPKPAQAPTPAPYTPGNEGSGAAAAPPPPPAPLEVDENDPLNWDINTGFLEEMQHEQRALVSGGLLASMAPVVQEQIMTMENLDLAYESLRVQLQELHVTAVLAVSSYAFMDDPIATARLATLKRKADTVFAQAMEEDVSCFASECAPSGGMQQGESGELSVVECTGEGEGSGPCRAGPEQGDEEGLVAMQLVQQAFCVALEAHS